MKNSILLILSLFCILNIPLLALADENIMPKYKDLLGNWKSEIGKSLLFGNYFIEFKFMPNNKCVIATTFIKDKTGDPLSMDGVESLRSLP